MKILTWFAKILKNKLCFMYLISEFQTLKILITLHDAENGYKTDSSKSFAPFCVICSSQKGTGTPENV